MIRIFIIAALALSLGGCGSFSCAGWEKFRPSRTDANSTKSQALKHNNYGRAQGCWS